MGIMAMAMLTLPCMAASDSEIMQFTKGVLASGLLSGSGSATIEKNTLGLTCQLSEYLDMKVDTVGYKLYDLSICAQKVIDQYPNRFNQVEIKVYASNGQGPIGYASIAVN